MPGSGLVFAGVWRREAGKLLLCQRYSGVPHAQRFAYLSDHQLLIGQIILFGEYVSQQADAEVRVRVVLTDAVADVADVQVFEQVFLVVVGIWIFAVGGREVRRQPRQAGRMRGKVPQCDLLVTVYRGLDARRQVLVERVIEID